MAPAGSEVLAALTRSGLVRGGQVALVVAAGTGVAMATGSGGSAVPVPAGDPAAVVRVVEEVLRPRWVVWSNATADGLLAAGVRLATCWDIAAVHRLVFGGWRAEPARVWAGLHDLAADQAPTVGPLDLFSQAADGDDPDEPLRADGHLRPEWVGGGWSAGPERLGRWAELAWTAAQLQQAVLAGRPDGPRALSTARSESTTELLCVELSSDGLPMSRRVAEQILADLIGPPPGPDGEATGQRARRDEAVLRHAPPGAAVDLRSPAQVRGMLARLGIDLPDTRAWRLRSVRDAHPIVDALLAWRKAERIATTYSYRWLDDHLGPDGRLRGAWTGCDGAAGRMTASAGLHNMPAALRGAVIAEAGHVFVRADLGQIEPRVLAAVSGDGALARATLAADLYAPVAAQLGVDRATAKVAVLGAMYGQTTGHGAQALRRLEAAYPVAMAYLSDAERAGRAGRPLRTYGGRLIPLGPADATADRRPESPGAAAARGRYARNAMIQGAAAELFKLWAVTVRARAERLGARTVLCLHDELLVHAPVAQAEAVARLVGDCLQEAAGRWAVDGSVRFPAEISVIGRWSDAKGAPTSPAVGRDVDPSPGARPVRA